RACRVAGTPLLDGGVPALLGPDTGPGIPPDRASRVFDRFTQATTEAKERLGTGLGLAISREIVILHGGEISLCGTGGGGTCVCVTLPLGTAHLADDVTILPAG